MKLKSKTKIYMFILSIGIIFIIIIYTFDNIISPTVIAVSEGEMRAKSIEVINRCILEEMKKNFNYDDIIKIEKDNEGNIVMLRADTLKLNLLATNISFNSQKELNQLGSVGIKIPLGYITKNNVLSYLGPKIIVKMEPLSNIETTYSSAFKTAGINQTSHKMFVKFKTRMRIIIPLKASDIDVYSEIPVCETIIVGKIPDTALQMGLEEAGYKNK